MCLQNAIFAVLLLLALPSTFARLCPAPALGPKKITVADTDDVWCSGLCAVDVNSGQYYPFTSTGRVCCSCEPPPQGGAPTTPTPTTPESSAPIPPPAPEAKKISDKELLGYISLDKGPGTDKDGTVTVRSVITIDGAPPVLTNQQLISVVLAFNNCTTVPWYIREQQPAEPGKLPLINPALSGRLNGRRRLLADGDCATRKEFIVGSAEDCSTKCDKRASDRTINVGSTYTADIILSEYNGNTCCKCRFIKGGNVTTASTDEEAEISSAAADEDDYDYVEAPTGDSAEGTTTGDYDQETDYDETTAPSDGGSDTSTEKAATPRPAAPTSPAVSSTATGVHFFADSTIQDGQVRDVLLFLRQCVAQGTFQQWLQAGDISVDSVELLYSGVGDIIFGASSGMDPLFGPAADPPPDSSDDGGDSLSLGAIIGITVGVACAAIIIAAIAAFVTSKKRRRNKDINSELLTHRWRLERELAESQRAKYANSRNMTLEDLERQRTLRRSQTANAHKNYTSGVVDGGGGNGNGTNTTPQSSKSMSRLDSMRSALGLGGISSSRGATTTPPPVGGYGVTASSGGGGGGDMGLARISPPADSPADTQLVGHVDSSNGDIESGQSSKKQKKFGRRLF